MLDSLSLNGAVVVCGPAYGCSSRFLDGVVGREREAVVELRPSSRVAVGRGARARERVPVSALLDRAKWRKLVVPVAGAGGRQVSYSASLLGVGRISSGPDGRLFAIQTGGIGGVHPGTVFGLSLVRDATLQELIEAVGWARWIRPLVRRLERVGAVEPAATSSRRSGTMNGSTPRLRANITLSRNHDEAASATRQVQHEGLPLMGAVGSGSRLLNVVELFAGAGGMGLGFLLASSKRSRYRVVCAAEVDPVCVETLRANHAALDRIHPGRTRRTPPEVAPIDLRGKKALDLVVRSAAERGGADVLIGGPPCQGFSNANRNSWSSSNPHNELIDVFLKYVVRLAPRVFLLENVQGIHWTRKTGGPRARSSVLEHITSRMASAGYEVFVQLLDAVWYGVPQYRSRFFILGIHRDLGYPGDAFGPWGPFPRPSHGPGTPRPYVTVHDAISDLPPVGNGHLADRTNYVEPRTVVTRKNSFLTFLRTGGEQGVITDHVTSRHADYVIERYRKIPAGGNWESIADTLTNYADVNRTHSNIYRRLVWDEPSITIGHYRKSMLVHPSQDRGLSLREAARLQSFPDWFRFAGNARGALGGLVHKQQQLANAVCPLVTRAIADLILEL
jgi:DNA-cytosine methyltransferase